MSDFDRDLDAMLADASQYRRDGKLDESRRTLMLALGHIDSTVGRNTTVAILPLLQIASGLRALSPLVRDALCSELEMQAYDLAISRLAESDSRVIRALSQYGSTLWLEGRNEEAAVMLARCAELSEVHGNKNALAYHINDLALVLMELNRSEEAVPLLERALRILGDRDATQYRWLTVVLGGALVKAGRFREALELLEPIQRRRVERRGEAPVDEITEWFEAAQRGASISPGEKPKAQKKKPRKR